MMTKDQIDDALAQLDVRPRLEGSNHLLLLDLVIPPDASGALADTLHAARALHRTIEADDALSDIEETLEDALKDGDARAIDDGCELYRALLADRFMDLVRGPDAEARLAALAQDDRDR